MPDIMCQDSHCPAKALCFRNLASGTIPNEAQWYAPITRPPQHGFCDSFWPPRAPIPWVGNA